MAWRSIHVNGKTGVTHQKCSRSKGDYLGLGKLSKRLVVYAKKKVLRVHIWVRGTGNMIFLKVSISLLQVSFQVGESINSRQKRLRLSTISQLERSKGCSGIKRLSIRSTLIRSFSLKCGTTS